MAIFARLVGYVGLEPGTTEVYHNREFANGWEELRVTVRGPEGWVDVDFVEHGGPLRLDQSTRRLVTGANHEGWGGQWVVGEDGKTLECDGVVLSLEGYRVAPPVSRLHIAGRDFVNEQGERYVVRGSTELLLAYLYDRAGEDVASAVFNERAALGFNNYRVLWQKGNNSNGLTAPWQMPTSKMPGFLGLAASYGGYVQGVILADCQIVNPSVSAQQQRVNEVRAATAGIANHLEQLGNEAGSGPGNSSKNGFDPRNFSRPGDRLAANSSSTTGGADYPYWDFFGFSGRRDPLNAWIRENGPVEFMYANGNPWGGVPAICDEGAKPGVNNDYQPRDWERAGAQAKSGCGGRFHSDAGTAGNSRLFNGFERECAAAFLQGLA